VATCNSKRGCQHCQSITKCLKCTSNFLIRPGVSAVGSSGSSLAWGLPLLDELKESWQGGWNSSEVGGTSSILSGSSGVRWLCWGQKNFFPGHGDLLELFWHWRI
jgi:hypothetical protein